METDHSSKLVPMPMAGKKTMEVARGNGSFTVEERKEVLSKRRMAEFKAMASGTIEMWSFLPKTPEQVELESPPILSRSGLFAAATLAAGGSALIYHKTVQESSVIAWMAIIFFIVSLMTQISRFEDERSTRRRIKKLQSQRTIIVPASAVIAYNGIVSNSQKIEDGDYPPSVVASARLSLEGVTNHLKIIGEHTARGTVKSAPCQKLLHEVYRIASEMEAYMAVEKQEERKLAAAVRRELGPSSVESERANESIQQTEGLTF